MNPIEQLKSKLAAADRRQKVEARWLKTFLPLFCFWALIIVPVSFYLEGGRWLGAGLTVFFAGTGVLVVYAQWRAEQSNDGD